MVATPQFKLPDVGEGLTEAEIVEWHVKVGDTVEVNDTLVEVETAKSLVELPSPFAGVITALHASEGETVEVGSVIVSFGNDSAAVENGVSPRAAELAPDVTGPIATAASMQADEPEEERQPVLVGYGPSRAKVARRPRKLGYRSLGESAVHFGTLDRHYATPPVRHRARELGIDLATVTPTGTTGRITRSDVEAARQQVSPSLELGESDQTRVPIRGVRKATAEAGTVTLIERISGVVGLEYAEMESCWGCSFFRRQHCSRRLPARPRIGRPSQCATRVRSVGVDGAGNAVKCPRKRRGSVARVRLI